MAGMESWHTREIEDVLQSLGSGHSGLTERETVLRRDSYGLNELQKKKSISPAKILIRQFANFLVLLLIAAAVVSLVLGDHLEAIVITAIVVLAGILGFVQEHRAERALEALKKLASPTASVLRDGEECEIPARELVPGDIILIRTGDQVPADARLVEAVNLKMD